MKIHLRRRATVGAAAAVLVGGCTSVVPRQSLRDVSRDVGGRIDQQMVWHDPDHPDPAIASATHELLSHDLSADAAAQIALFNNRDLQASIDELGIGQAELVQAGLLSNPVFAAMVRFPDGATGGSNIELSVSENFIELLTLPMRKRVAAAQFEATKARAAGEVIQLAGEVRQAYFDALAAQQILALRELLRAVADADETANAELRRAGNVPQLQYLTRRAATMQAELNLTIAQSTATKAREHLLLLLDLPRSERNEAKFPSTQPTVPSEKLSGDFESLAIHQRLDLAAQISGANALAAALGVTARLSWLENATLTVDGEHEVEGYWVTGPGVSVPVPIFDTGAAKIAAARGRLQQATARLQAAGERVRSEVRTAAAALAAAQSRAEFIQQKLVPLRHSIVDETMSHYNAMSASAFDVLDARRDELQAQIDSAEATRDYWIARVELERAVGGKINTTIERPTPTK